MEHGKQKGRAKKRNPNKKPLPPTTEGGPVTFLEKVDLCLDKALARSSEELLTNIEFYLRVLLSEDEFGLQEADMDGELYQSELKKFREERWLRKQLEGLGQENS